MKFYKVDWKIFSGHVIHDPVSGDYDHQENRSVVVTCESAEQAKRLVKQAYAGDVIGIKVKRLEG
ncbi:hypothetical protein CL634_08430 [bacterium]|nr:hypothetical protein [bacterium]|tara:strand:+ start:316 stop:510 length:195 start_codon:yes stop_codon:yes gene_type:complete